MICGWGLRRATLNHERSCFWRVTFLIVINMLAIVGGCASPGEPLERKAPVPEAVKDLAAEQSGNSVVLTFNLPTETVDRRPLRQIPAVEIYRDFEPSSSTPGPAAHPTLITTIPSAMVSQYSNRGHFRYADSLSAGDFPGPSGQIARYSVRTRESPKKSSEDSNAVSLHVYPTPGAIDNLKTEVTHGGIVLTWTAPQAASAGVAPTVNAYAIYRAPVASGASAAESQAAKLESPLMKIGESATPGYQDSQTIFGDTYAYSVRSVTQYGDKSLESGDSNVAVVVDRDTFPPATPLGLVIVPIPARDGMPASLDLSWAISPEPDTAGYNVYRSDAGDGAGTRQNSSLLPVPAFRDINIAPGRIYSYSVTAVDRSGNESSPSQPVQATAPTESQVVQ